VGVKVGKPVCGVDRNFFNSHILDCEPG